MFELEVECNGCLNTNITNSYKEITDPSEYDFDPSKPILALFTIDSFEQDGIKQFYFLFIDNNKSITSENYIDEGYGNLKIKIKVKDKIEHNVAYEYSEGDTTAKIFLFDNNVFLYQTMLSPGVVDYNTSYIDPKNDFITLSGENIEILGNGNLRTNSNNPITFVKTQNTYNPYTELDETSKIYKNAVYYRIDNVNKIVYILVTTDSKIKIMDPTEAKYFDDLEFANGNYENISGIYAVQADNKKIRYTTTKTEKSEAYNGIYTLLE